LFVCLINLKFEEPVDLIWSSCS